MIFFPVEFGLYYTQKLGLCFRPLHASNCICQQSGIFRILSQPVCMSEGNCTQILSCHVTRSVIQLWSCFRMAFSLDSLISHDVLIARCVFRAFAILTWKNTCAVLPCRATRPQLHQYFFLHCPLVEGLQNTVIFPYLVIQRSCLVQQLR